MRRKKEKEKREKLLTPFALRMAQPTIRFVPLPQAHKSATQFQGRFST